MENICKKHSYGEWIYIRKPICCYCIIYVGTYRTVDVGVCLNAVDSSTAYLTKVIASK